MAMVTDKQGRPYTILDAAGKPIDLAQRHADDGFALGHVMTFSALIGSAYNTYYHQWDEAMRNSREHALAMRRDPYLMALVQERKDATTNLKWHLEADNPRDPWQAPVSASLQKMVAATPELISMMDYLGEAMWYGRYGSMLKWRWADMNLPVGTLRGHSSVPGSGRLKETATKCLVVQSHYPVNGDKIGHFHDHTPYVRLRADHRDQIKGIPEIVITTQGFGLSLAGEWQERCMIHYHTRNDADYFEPEMAEGVHGVGIRSTIYWFDFLRKEFMATVMDYLERIGLGIVMVEYDAGNPKAQQEAEEIAKSLSRKSVITVPVTKNQAERGGGVRIVEGPTAGVQILLGLREYCDRMIERYVVGQAMSGGLVTGASSAGLAAVASKTQHRRFSGDAHRLAETLAGSKKRPGLVSIMKQHTFPWADFRVKWCYEIEDPESERKLGAASMFVNMGGNVVEDEVRALTGLSEPGPDDETIDATTIQTLMATVPPPAGGSPGPGNPQGAQGQLGQGKPPEQKKNPSDKGGEDEIAQLLGGIHEDSVVRRGATTMMRREEPVRYALPLDDGFEGDPPSTPLAGFDPPVPVKRKTQVQRVGPAPMPEGAGDQGRRAAEKEWRTPPSLEKAPPSWQSSRHDVDYGIARERGETEREPEAATSEEWVRWRNDVRSMEGLPEHLRSAALALRDVPEVAHDVAKNWRSDEPEKRKISLLTHAVQLAKKSREYPYLREVVAHDSPALAESPVFRLQRILAAHDHREQAQKSIPVGEGRSDDGLRFEEKMFPNGERDVDYTLAIPYEELPVHPRPGERLYFRARRGGRILATGVPQGEVADWEVGGKWKIPLKIHNTRKTKQVHSEIEREAYRSGYAGEDDPSRLVRDRTEFEGEELSRYRELGQRDAMSLRPYGLSVPGMQDVNPEEERRIWLRRHRDVRELSPSLAMGNMRLAGLEFMNLGDWDSSGPASPGGGDQSLGDLLDSSVHDKIYDRYRSEMKGLSTRSDRKEVEDILVPAIREEMKKVFRPDEMPYESFRRLLYENRETYRPTSFDLRTMETLRRQSVFLSRIGHKLLRTAPASFRKMAAKVGGDFPEDDNTPDMMGWAHTIEDRMANRNRLKESGRDRAFPFRNTSAFVDGLAREWNRRRAGQRDVRFHREGEESERYLRNLFERERIEQRDRRQQRRENSRDEVRESEVQEGEVDDALPFHRDDGMMRGKPHGWGEVVDSQPDGDEAERYARQGLGSFANRGYMAKEGEGTDYPSLDRHRGPLEPPQPPALQGRRMPEGRSSNPRVPPQAPAPAPARQPPPVSPLQQQPAQPPELSKSSLNPWLLAPAGRDHSFQEKVEHNPSDDPDAFAEERREPSMTAEGMGLDEETLAALRALTDEAWGGERGRRSR